MTHARAPVAVVTGGGSGIGRAVALALSGAGFCVAILGRRAGPLKETAEQAAAGTNSIIAHVADVAKDADVARAFDATADKLGGIDVVFNNAGISAPPVPLDELTPEHWQSVVDVNLTGVFNCCRHAMRIMKAQSPKGGRIINNGSISAMTPRPFSAPYTATKHAVTGLTKAIALDGRADNIACGQIDIGNAATEMTARMRDGIVQPDGTTRPEPCMDISDVADAVVYMARLPLSANVLSMTLKATTMPFEGRG